MNTDEYEKAIKFYRDLAIEEMENEKIMNGTLIGPRSEVNMDDLTIKDLINPSRPFLAMGVGAESDSAYASTFRIGHFNMPKELAATGQGTTFVGGMEFGSNLVKQKIIENESDLLKFLIDYKVGILDIYDVIEVNGDKIIDLRVYECIECVDLPNIGKPSCFFEAGIITGFFKELTNKAVMAEEIRCWTNGYSFCQFDVTIKLND